MMSCQPTFKIGKNITLKLEGKKTNIYIQDQLFRQCKSLFLSIDIVKSEEIKSIDQAVELSKIQIVNIDPKHEFWGHCSNLQAWYENDYDTRLLQFEYNEIKNI